MTGPSVLLIAAFDSQLKWAAGVAEAFCARGFTARFVVPDVRSALSARQREDAGVAAIAHVHWDELVDLALQHDVVVCALAGPQVRRLSIEISSRAITPGPILVAGWVGIIIERITAGYLDRSGADVVVVNAAHELAHFRHAAERLGLPDDNLLLAGLPFLSGTPREQSSEAVRTVLFADQPTVPATREERLYVYSRLLDYARKHPSRTVLLKPRHLRGEDTFHRMSHHPEDLVAELGDERPLPPNFRIDHTPIGQVIDDVDLLITVSSTACLEAVDRGKRVGLVLDLGVHERHGNHVFLDSGLLRTFDQLEADDIGVPESTWVDSYFSRGTDSTADVVVDRVEKLLATDERPSHAVWESAYFRATSQVELLGPGRPGALQRRVAQFGPVLGVGVHLGALWTPPVVTRTVRRGYRHLHP